MVSDVFVESISAEGCITFEYWNLRDEASSQVLGDDDEDDEDDGDPMDFSMMF